MSAIADYFRRLRSRQVVRPWALCAPVLVLVIALPLLRPLRAPNDASESELSQMATIEALVEREGLVINDTDYFNSLRRGEGNHDHATSIPFPIRPTGEAVGGTIHVGTKYYSDQPAVMSYVLSWPYALMHRLGWDFEHYPTLVVYVLTMLGVTLPVAGAAGLIYRMGRMFELKRPVRTGLALAVALGSGLLSYATVLNPHAPAAALILSACACLFHITVARKPASSGAWLMIAGLCAALAAVIDLSAVVFLILFVGVILAFRWKWSMKVGGVILYLVGATPPIVLHAALTLPVTGDLRPGIFHTELGAVRQVSSGDGAAAADELDDTIRTDSWKTALFRGLDRTIGALLGGKGLFSHYPVAIVGALGLGMVLRRHWPASTKVMAGVTIAGALFVIAGSISPKVDWGQPMFGPRWFVLFLPLVLFWAGAWLRRRHHVITWSAAGVLLAFSIAVSILGAATPGVQAREGQYTVAAALHKLMHGEETSEKGMDAMAGR